MLWRRSCRHQRPVGLKKTIRTCMISMMCAVKQDFSVLVCQTWAVTIQYALSAFCKVSWLRDSSAKKLVLNISSILQKRYVTLAATIECMNVRYLASYRRPGTWRVFGNIADCTGLLSKLIQVQELLEYQKVHLPQCKLEAEKQTS